MTTRARFTVGRDGIHVPAEQLHARPSPNWPAIRARRRAARALRQTLAACALHNESPAK